MVSSTWPSEEPFTSHRPEPPCTPLVLPTQAGLATAAARPDSWAATTSWARSRAPSLAIARVAWVFAVEVLR